jgi:hypothetical protein
MTILTEQLIKGFLEDFNSPEKRILRDEDLKRSLVYNGKIKEVVQDAIRKEFKKPETIIELNNRLIPINIVSKVIWKLSQVYNEAPIRKPYDGNEDDSELLSSYEQEMCIDKVMKEVNAHFKLYKRALIEIYRNKYGRPAIRPIDRPSYEVYSTSAISPEIPDVVLKVIHWDDGDLKKCVLIWWSDESFLITDGAGKKNESEHARINNPDAVNPYGVLPFVYINQSLTRLVPMPDDDLIKTGIAVPLLLSDLSFASKYQAWSMIYTIGVDGEIPINPNSVVNLEFGEDGQRPEIDMIKPEINIPQMLEFVRTLIAMLLSTKNLSTSSISGDLSAENVASGISKMLDQAETIEDRKDQQQFFIDAEKELWKKLSKNIIPIWIKLNDYPTELKQNFSENFELAMIFKQPTVIMTEKERVENSVFKIEKGVSTLKRELKALNPALDENEIDQLVAEIREDKLERVNTLRDQFANQPDPNEDDESIS